MRDYLIGFFREFFSTCHDTWMKKYRRMISTKEYYDFCSDVIREVCEVFGHPRFFHLGMDEEDFYGLCCDADRLYVARKKLYPETLE